MLTVNNINTRIQDYSSSFQNKSQQRLSNREKLAQLPDNKKISFNEGGQLLLKGFTTQTVEMFRSIIEHPLQTVALVGGTTLGLVALPVIGIPSTVGGSVIALGFAGYAIGKATYHGALFAKNNKQGSYQSAREHLQKIGEDTFDLALSVPFIPKAAVQVKKFSKYGKVEINKTLINDIKSAKIFSKFKTLINQDKELLRDINFKNAVDEEIVNASLDKVKLKQALLDFNVTPDEIPKVVLNKYSEIKGIKTQPDLKYESYPANICGYSIAKDCSIRFNDFKIKFKNKTFDNYQKLSVMDFGDVFVVKYKETNSGKIIIETIQKDILLEYESLMAEYAKLTSETKKILTTVHEREHINQYAQMISKKGYEWIKHSITPRGKELFDKMLTEMPEIDINSPLSMEIEKYFLSPASQSPVSYIKQPIEIGARRVETKALNHPVFKMLNNIFKKVNNKKTETSIEKNILLNDARFESANA